MVLPNKRTYAERLEYGPMKISEQIRLGMEEPKVHSCSLSVSQIEAWLFVKRISLDGLWSQPIGPGREALTSMDWVGRMMPPVSGVYFVCVEDGDCVTPIYVGMTRAGLDKRISGRHGVSIKAALQYAKSLLWLRYIPISDAMDIVAIEAAAISFWEPPLNIQKPMPPKNEIEQYILELRDLLD